MWRSVCNFWKQKCFCKCFGLWHKNRFWLNTKLRPSLHARAERSQNRIDSLLFPFLDWFSFLSDSGAHLQHCNFLGLRKKEKGRKSLFCIASPSVWAGWGEVWRIWNYRHANEKKEGKTVDAQKKKIIFRIILPLPPLLPFSWCSCCMNYSENWITSPRNK